MGKKKNKNRLTITEFNRSVSAPSERFTRAISRYAKLFIKKCFVAEPEKRATASELLEDSFITE